jgi:hypothetical protein
MRFTTNRHGLSGGLSHGGTRSRGCGGRPWRCSRRRSGGKPWWGDRRRSTASVAGPRRRCGGGPRWSNRRCRSAASNRGSRRRRAGRPWRGNRRCRCGGRPWRGGGRRSGAGAAGPWRRRRGRPWWGSRRRHSTTSIRRPWCRSRRPRYGCFGRFVTAAARGPRRRCGGGRLTGLARRHRRARRCRRFCRRGLCRLGGGRPRSLCGGGAGRGGLVGGTSRDFARRRRCTVIAVGRGRPFRHRRLSILLAEHVQRDADPLPSEPQLRALATSPNRHNTGFICITGECGTNMANRGSDHEISPTCGETPARHWCRRSRMNWTARY